MKKIKELEDAKKEALQILNEADSFILITDKIKGKDKGIYKKMYIPTVSDAPRIAMVLERESKYIKNVFLSIFNKEEEEEVKNEEPKDKYIG